MIYPKVKYDSNGMLLFEYPQGFKGPFAANPIAESDANVLRQVIFEIREIFKNEDPTTNPDFANFLKDLDRLDRLADSLDNIIDLNSLNGKIDA